MDLKKNGKFLSEIRKEQNLTQKQLAEQLGVSDKTVSKWECGNSFPDVEMMLPLCKALHISVNELISGERISANEYLERAEINMVNLVQDNKKEKRSTLKTILSRVVFILLLIDILWSCIGLNLEYVSIYFDIVSLLGGIVITLLALQYLNLLKDFKKSFSLLRRDEIEEEEGKRAVIAVGVAEKMMIYSGIFITVFSAIYVLISFQSLDDIVNLCANFAVCLLSLFYGLLGAMFLHLIRTRLEIRL